MRKLWFSFAIMLMIALVLSACGGGAPAADSQQANTAASQPTQAPQMTHDANPMSDNSYDVHFIDSTLDHHMGVLAMAEQALKESQTVALKDLAQQSMTTTQKEIDWLKAYRQKNHPNAGIMKDNMDMGAMGISTDQSKSFDRRFAEAMIAHHQGSIKMANEALTQVGHDELKQFAQAMIAVEEAEVNQLKQYLQ